MIGRSFFRKGTLGKVRAPERISSLGGDVPQRWPPYVAKILLIKVIFRGLYYPGCLLYIGDDTIQYIGIIINQYKDPYEPISILECQRFERDITWEKISQRNRFFPKFPADGWNPSATFADWNSWYERPSKGKGKGKSSNSQRWL